MTRLALITGASSGIGRAYALRLGAEGYDLVAVGRRRERLDQLAAALPDVEVRPLVADLAADAGVEKVAEVCAQEDVAILVNNAGVAHYMPFAELPAAKASELLHVKVVAPTMLARAAAPGMVSRGEGTIVNVSGMLAFSGPASLRGAAAASRRLRRDARAHRRVLAGSARGAEGRRRAGAGAVPRCRGDGVP